ncbi:MAG: ATP-binding cassette domain-containing protein [Chthoniobacterales bacterium]
MIQVHSLSKKYVGVTAIDGISFDVARGDIVGFLGPNGAGKSTTMRILAGFMPPSSGQAFVAGFDVFKDSIRARERIGYMPENVPLYSEMRVREYLRYRAALKGVRGRKIRERVGDVIDLCSLQSVEKKLIGSLSKGYRQRVGLADAMVHEPDLLILDEPTIGLDPNQIRQVRDLIRNLGRHHTILLSTHILSEVEMVCQKVIILNKGRIEAVDTPENLRRHLHAAGDVQLEIPKAQRAEIERVLGAFPEVKSVRSEAMEEWVRLTLEYEGERDLRPLIYEACVKNNCSLRELTRRRVSLEQVFAEITEGEPK